MTDKSWNKQVLAVSEMIEHAINMEEQQIAITNRYPQKHFDEWYAIERSWNEL